MEFDDDSHHLNCVIPTSKMVEGESSSSSLHHFAIEDKKSSRKQSKGPISSSSTSSDGDLECSISSKKQKLERVRAKLQELNEKHDRVLDSQGNAVNAENRTAKAEAVSEVQSRLVQAREKLTSALHKREKAIQRSGSVLTPISALSADLTLENVASTGPSDTVYFPSSSLPADVDGSALHCENSPNEGGPLLERKEALEQELQGLRSKLQSIQAGIDLGGTDNDFELPSESTRIELTKRKEQAQATVDLSYWRLFVSKQEHMLHETKRRLAENITATDQCHAETQHTQERIKGAELLVNDLQARERAVICHMSRVAKDILEARTILHSETMDG